MSATLFIDANQYLELYRTIEGKKLLDSLDEQKPYIFISAQIVDEVLRNKLQVAKSFFTERLKEINTVNAPVPDHLFGISDQKTTHFREVIEQANEQAKQAVKELSKLASDALSRISRSEDDVSRRLGEVFD
ncbi:MAG: hypothetical protein WBD65_13870, partial [Methylocella sp.]